MQQSRIFKLHLESEIYFFFNKTAFIFSVNQKTFRTF